MGFGEARRQAALQRAEHELLFRSHYRTLVTYLAARIPIEDAKQRVLKQLAAAPAAEPASEKPAEKKGPAAADAKAAESK